MVVWESQKGAEKRAMKKIVLWKEALLKPPMLLIFAATCLYNENDIVSFEGHFRKICFCAMNRNPLGFEFSR